CRADGSQICQGGRCIEAQCFGHQQCRVGSRCVAGACQLGPPGDGGGTCAAPTRLAVGEVARGRPQNEQQFGTCSIGEEVSGPEAVYLFNATFTGDLCLTTAWHTWTGFNAEVYVRQAMCPDGVELGCNDGGASEFAGLSPDGESDQGALTVQVVAGQSYFVFVDARIGGVDPEDRYVLSALRGTCDGAQLPTACDEPQHVELGEVYVGNSRLGSYAHEGSCADGNDDGAEQVVHFRSGPQAGPICVRIDGDNAGDTDSIYVRATSCADGAEVGCSTERRPADRKITVDAEANTDYFVFVDSSLRGSEYALSVTEGVCFP
ncbi:MAG: hypothetical protein VX589_14305, partial [Myxococcota bacterium]|nr:hypothetical protein [Myxococcota bacterium]